VKTEVRLAQHGMGMQEATVVQWLKQEGDPVEIGEVILEVEAEKATLEIEATAAGVLSKILAQVEEVVEVGALLCEISGDGDDAAAPETVAQSADAGDVAVVALPRTGASDAAFQCEPRARRLALDEGVDLSSVIGTGPGGRITEADVRQKMASG
jgi:pyruvate/2-oxoglutarate dehydrogenase complex dihydrolipoamide acyltransferase (E2) component